MARKKQEAQPDGPVSQVLDGPPDPLQQVEDLSTSVRNDATSDPGGAPATAVEVEAVFAVPVRDIIPWDVCEDVRREVNGDALMSLKASIQQHGLKTPLWACPAADGRWLLIAGYRRLQCARELGLQTVPVIQKHTTDANEAKFLSVLENSAREDLSEIDSFRMLSWIRGAYPERVLHTETGEREAGKFNIGAVAVLTGRSASWARSHCRALEFFTMAELVAINECIANQNAAETPEGSRLTWGRVLYAATDATNKGWHDEIMSIVTGAPMPDKPVKVKKAARNPVKTVFVPTRCEMLDTEGLDLRFGTTKNIGIENLTLRATVEIPFKPGKTGFAAGEKGEAKTTQLFEAIGNHFLALAKKGTGAKAKDKDVEARTALRESIDAALAKLAAKVGG